MRLPSEASGWPDQGREGCVLAEERAVQAWALSVPTFIIDRRHAVVGPRTRRCWRRRSGRVCSHDHLIPGPAARWMAAPCDARARAGVVTPAHCFDIAAQATKSVARVQQKRSRDPGTAEEMVAARRRYLNAGFYQPIAALVSRAVLADLPTGGPGAVCLDAGCGEAITCVSWCDRRRRRQHLALSRPGYLEMGGAGRGQAGQATELGGGQQRQVAGAARLRSTGCCTFGFPVYAEFRPVLRPGGELLQVDAGRTICAELREII